MVLLNSSSCNFDWQPNNFQFSNLRGDQGSFYDSFDINGLLVMFICNHSLMSDLLKIKFLVKPKDLKR